MTRPSPRLNPSRRSPLAILPVHGCHAHPLTNPPPRRRGASAGAALPRRLRPPPPLPNLLRLRRLPFHAVSVRRGREPMRPQRGGHVPPRVRTAVAGGVGAAGQPRRGGWAPHAAVVGSVGCESGSGTWRPGEAGGGARRGGVRAARSSRAAMGGGNLFALDFDGVFYDSYGQSSHSAVKAAKVRWAWVFEQVATAMEEWMVEQMHPALVAKPTPEATQRQSHNRTCAPSAPATGQGLLLPWMFWPDLCFGSLGMGGFYNSNDVPTRRRQTHKHKPVFPRAVALDT